MDPEVRALFDGADKDGCAFDIIALDAEFEPENSAFVEGLGQLRFAQWQAQRKNVRSGEELLQ